MNTRDFLGRGLHFPIGVEPSTGRFLESGEEDKIGEAIKILLLTKKGERLMRPELGCDIWQYLFGVMDYTTLSMMKEAVRDALIRWEPRICEVEIEVRPANGEAAVMLEIHYRVRATNNPYNLVFPFYLEEGIAT